MFEFVSPAQAGVQLVRSRQHWIPVALHAFNAASRGSEARNDGFKTSFVTLLTSRLQAFPGDNAHRRAGDLTPS
jgi:hypothetical protein